MTSRFSLCETSFSHCVTSVYFRASILIFKYSAVAIFSKKKNKEERKTIDQ